MPLCPRRAGLTTREKAEAALSAAYKGVDCGAQTPLVCPRPTDVPSLPKVPTLEEAERTLLAAMRGVECDADAVLAAEMFLEALATGSQAQEVRPDDLHTSNTSLPVCTDDHLPVATTPEEAEAEAALADADTADACDGSRGGTLTLCRGGHVNCVMVDEYTGPPKSIRGISPVRGSSSFDICPFPSSTAKTRCQRLQHTNAHAVLSGVGRVHHGVYRRRGEVLSVSVLARPTDVAGRRTAVRSIGRRWVDASKCPPASSSA